MFSSPIIVLSALALVALHTTGSHGLPTAKSAPLELIILHNNDMHARFEQTGKYSNTCQPEDALANVCYGGFARVSTKLKEYRDKAAQGGTPVLYLNAGDTYTGTPWFTLYKDEIVADFLNVLKPDAISLGNHEFDLGVEGLMPFLSAAKFPVLITNMDASKEPTLQNSTALKTSAKFNVNGVNVGVIGYLTPETKSMAPPSGVQFTDEIKAINKESAILKASGVNIIIALGHSGLDVDKMIAEQCPDVDLVIGGHSHTFLYTGTPPDVEIPVDTYPVIVQRANGRRVPVVQAYAFTKYLGYLHLNFDSDGNLATFDGSPILLDNKVPRDPAVLSLLAKYKPGVIKMQSEVVGKSVVFLNGTCRFNECNMGNFITDAIVYDYARAYEGDYWTDAAIALVQGGGIRTSVDIGNITMYDMTTLLPFETKLVTIDVSGTELKDALEHSVYRYDGISGWGEFLQMSGIQVVYNLTKPAKERVTSVVVRCARCSIPLFTPLQPTQKYKIIISSFLQSGGDGYTMFNKPFTQLAVTELDSTRAYIKQLELIYPPIEWRITLTGKTSGAVSLHWSIAGTLVAVVVSLMWNY